MEQILAMKQGFSVYIVCNVFLGITQKCFILQIDKLSTELQERDLTISQRETLFRSEMADKGEENHRLKAEISILHEKLSQNGGQVC